MCAIEELINIIITRAERFISHCTVDVLQFLYKSQSTEGLVWIVPAFSHRAWESIAEFLQGNYLRL